MADRSRVPKAQNKFDKYIKGAVNILLANWGNTMIPNWQMLGLTSEDMDKIKSFLIRWWSGNPAAPGAYELHCNTYGLTKIEGVTSKNVKAIIKEFSKYFSPMLYRIEGSPNITSEIRLMLHIALRVTNREKKLSEIVASCFVKVISILGRKVKLKCSSETDGRASILNNERNIIIEVRLSITSPTIDEAGNFIPPKPPTSSNDPSLNINEVSPRASFYLQTIPEGSAGKTLQGFARWADLHNPKRKGPWTPIPPTMLS